VSTPKEAPVPSRVLVWRDIRYTLVWGGKAGNVDSSSAWMNFELHEIHGFRVEDDGDEDTTWPPLYRSSRPDDTTRVEESEATFSGFIKWDGCMQFRSPDGWNFHFDDRAGIRHLTEALERIRDLMREIGAAHGRAGEIEGRDGR
jgi:hypothetical protein